jgi:hypothetical protein
LALVFLVDSARFYLTSRISGEVVVNTRPILVKEQELRTLIDGLDLKEKQKNEYLKARWLNRAEFFRRTRSGSNHPVELTRRILGVE